MVEYPSDEQALLLSTKEIHPFFPISVRASAGRNFRSRNRQAQEITFLKWAVALRDARPAQEIRYTIWKKNSNNSGCE